MSQSLSDVYLTYNHIFLFAKNNTINLEIQPKQRVPPHSSWALLEPLFTNEKTILINRNIYLVIEWD